MTTPVRPLASRLELACLPDAVRWARGHTTDILGSWRLPPELIETAELLVSELTTNAVRYGSLGQEPTGQAELTDIDRFVLTLGYFPGRLLIQVYDNNRRPPIPKAPAPDDAEGGRGLMLVQALSSRWGFNRPHGAPGKIVWCELRVLATPFPVGFVSPALRRMGPEESDKGPPHPGPGLMNRVLVALREA